MKVVVTVPPAFSTAAFAHRRRTGHFDIDLRLDLALAEQAHAVAALLGEARLAQDLFGDLLPSVEPLVVDRLLQAADVHFREIVARRCC